MESKSITILLADDHQLFIDGLRFLLEKEECILIIAVAPDGQELLELLKKQTPDMVLLDINMPKVNGLECCRQIKQLYPKISVIMLSTYNESHLIEKAKTHGANGYLLKNSDKAELIQSIRLVANGRTSFPYRLPNSASEFSGQDDFLKRFNLTRRELEIIGLIKAEMSNQEIADKLFLSNYTVGTHRKNIMQKLGLHTPAALMKFILENNL
ncbi:MAG: response regulator transcription factor [Sphingobacteriaceae bacterium]|nr:MAG: response regulator transcription factor [Sphingobacteriaceae bacterium]